MLARRIEELIALGYDGLQSRLGSVSRSWAGGRIQIRKGGAPTTEDVAAPSGRLYQFEIAIDDLGDEVDVSVELFENRDASLPTLVDGFEMTADGKVTRYPAD